MIALFALLFIGAASAAFYDEYSAILVWGGPAAQSSYYANNVTVATSPIPNTKQITIFMNSTASYSYSTGVFLGGRGSVYGGVLTLAPNNCQFNGGYNMLDDLDLSSKGWLSKAKVDKIGTLVRYSRNCSYVFPCSALCMAGYCSSSNSQGFVTMDFASSNAAPVYSYYSYIGATAPTFMLNFTSFSSSYSKLVQKSVFVAPASCYKTLPNPTPMNKTTMTFYRSFTNDSFARQLENDNVADAMGEMYWACASSVSALIFAQFDITLDARFATYRLCNKGMCDCVGDFASCQQVGTKPPCTGCGNWYSLPMSARCPRGFPLGTNNCSWLADYTLVRAISQPCFHTIKSPIYPNGLVCGDYNKTAQHLVYAMANCPDIKSTLEYPN